MVSENNKKQTGYIAAELQYIGICAVQMFHMLFK
jgi:hypothetical protein